MSSGRYRAASVSLLDTDDWYPARLLFDREGSCAGAGRPGLAGPSSSVGASAWRCAARACLETIALDLGACPECGEPTAQSGGPASTSRLQSIPDDRR
jgi:hypothetical protein